MKCPKEAPHERKAATGAKAGPSARTRRRDAPAAGLRAEISRLRQAQGQGRADHRRRQRDRTRGGGGDGARRRQDRDRSIWRSTRTPTRPSRRSRRKEARRSRSRAMSATRSSAATSVEKTVKEFGRIDILVNNAAEQHETEDFREIEAEADRAHLPHQRFQLFLHGQARAPPHEERRLDHQHDLDHRLQGPQDAARLFRHQGRHRHLHALALGGAGRKMEFASTRWRRGRSGRRSFRRRSSRSGSPSTAPARRWSGAGQPNEVAPCFVFLASEDASYISGQVLHPNGGNVVGS